MNIIDAHIHPFEKTEQRSGRYSEQVADQDAFRSDLERAGITHCCGSVSYTHLDVYKRQAYGEYHPAQSRQGLP